MNMTFPTRAWSLALLWALGFLLPSEAGAQATAKFAFDDFLVVPLRVHLLTATSAPNWNTTLSDKDVSRILSKVNTIWAQAGVHFYLESLVREAANGQENYEELKTQANLQWLLRLRPEESKSESMFHVYYVKELSVNGIHFAGGNFVQDKATLREVPGGIDEPLPRVTAHELGHALGLSHRQNETNLLASRTTGTALDPQEIKQARAQARKFDWIESAPAIMQQADQRFHDAKKEEARRLYERLAKLPVETDSVERARKRSAENQ